MRIINDISTIIDKKDLKGKNILFLQGPLGTFFTNLADRLEKDLGVNKCYQLALNKGDEFFAKKDRAIKYKGALSDFEDWIDNFYKDKNIDYIFLLGDAREYHKRAINKAKENNIKVYVFEEGYFRPNYITLEENGVNNNSNLPREIDFYLSQEIESLRKENVKRKIEIGQVYYYMARSAVIYYLLMYLFNMSYKNYKHHRTRSVYIEFYAGLVNYIRRKKNAITEKSIYNKISNLEKKYFLVVLQVREDFQVREHSDYSSVESYIEEVLISFKESNKDPKSHLVIKHHPMDRGKVDYSSFIKEVCFHIKLDRKKVFYVYDINLPEVLKSAKGCVTINSTVGLQSLHHSIPVKVMGRAMYDIEGLTYQGSLADFWNEKIEVNKNNYEHYREYLINKTQISGSFFVKTFEY